MKESVFDGDGDGEGAAKDYRLKKQLERVFAALAGEKWVTLEMVAAASHAPEASVSARLRDLRKARFGGFVIEQRLTPTEGLHEYRLLAGSGNPELVKVPLRESPTPTLPCPHCDGSGRVAHPRPLTEVLAGQTELF